MSALTQMLETWEARSRGANPCDAMLINKHIREVRELLAANAVSAEPEILAQYSGFNGHRQWATASAWLYPGDAIAVISDHFPDAKQTAQPQAQAVASGITLAQLVQAMSERDLPPEVTQKVVEQIAGLALSDPATEQFLRRLLAGSGTTDTAAPEQKP